MNAEPMKENSAGDLQIILCKIVAGCVNERTDSIKPFLGERRRRRRRLGHVQSICASAGAASWPAMDERNTGEGGGLGEGVKQLRINPLGCMDYLCSAGTFGPCDHEHRHANTHLTYFFNSKLMGFIDLMD